MSATHDRNETNPREIHITRRFDSPRAEVFTYWTEPPALATWFAPGDFTVTHVEVDARPGGLWRVEYRSETLSVVESGEFLEVLAPEKLVLTLTQKLGDVTGPPTTVTVTLSEIPEGTRMDFHQTGFTSERVRAENMEGWNNCFDQQSSHLAEAEVRALFEAWFEASERRDLDGSMAPISPHVVSYEHEAPLQCNDIEVLREVCRRGYEAAQGDFRWDIPDLQIIVRGDIAVTWGLNRMRSHEPSKDAVDMWSRGTRIFQRIAGQWKMIHQHVSFPFDPQTGAARLDLHP